MNLLEVNVCRLAHNSGLCRKFFYCVVPFCTAPVTSFAPELADHQRSTRTTTSSPRPVRRSLQPSPASTMQDAFFDSHGSDMGLSPSHLAYSAGNGGSARSLYDPHLDGMVQRVLGDAAGAVSTHSSPMCGMWDQRYVMEQSVDYVEPVMMGDEPHAVSTGKRQRENLPKPTVQVRGTDQLVCFEGYKADRPYC